jgi:flagellar assembly factor FliW
MARCRTKYFQEIEYDESSVLAFPLGLPGFEAERGFVPIDHEGTRPLVYLQSLRDPELCFVTLPVLTVDPEYALELSDEDRKAIGLQGRTPLEIGKDVLCLTVVAIREEGATANLMAPLVAGLASRLAVQAIGCSGKYGHQHPLSN